MVPDAILTGPRIVEKSKAKTLAAEMVAAVKLHTARALDARLAPLEARLLELENSDGGENVKLRKRIAELERQGRR